jgi:hypothetical protein
MTTLNDESLRTELLARRRHIQQVPVSACRPPSC